MEKRMVQLRDILFRVLQNEALFFVLAFLVRGVLESDLLYWHKDALNQVYNYVLCPWGGILIGMHLMNLQQMRSVRRDMAVLFLLFLWICIPFLYRYGFTFNNLVTDVGYLMVFFAIYARTSSRNIADRRTILRIAGFLLSLVALIWGGMLLLCAVSGKTYVMAENATVFGVDAFGFLCAGMHYNHVGMIAVVCLFFCLAAFSEEKHPLRFFYLLAAVIMMLVIILSQSRTARYAVLLAFAFGTFAFAVRRNYSHRLLHIAVPVMTAAVILVAGYMACSLVTRTALAHYLQNAETAVPENVVPENAAPENAASESVAPENTALESTVPENSAPVERKFADATFSERTLIWKNLFELWHKEPKMLLIGRGIGKTGALVVKGTVHENAGAVAIHNTYLQFMADFGIIGMIIQGFFLLMMVCRILKVLFVFPREKQPAGTLPLCMLILAIMATGMMESQPLGQMTPMNLGLYMAFALLIPEKEQMLEVKGRN